jgi:hypothetical protein
MNSEKTCHSATLSTTNPTWTDPGLHSERLATNCLSYGTALHIWLVLSFTVHIYHPKHQDPSSYELNMRLNFINY